VKSTLQEYDCLTHTFACFKSRLRQRPFRHSPAVPATLNPELLGAGRQGGPLTAADGGVLGDAPWNVGKPLDSQIAICQREGQFTGSRQTVEKGPELHLPLRIHGATSGSSNSRHDPRCLNEKGLNVGLLYFPGLRPIHPPPTTQGKEPPCPPQLGAWLSCQFRHGVNELRAGLKNVDVTAAQVNQPAG